MRGTTDVGAATKWSDRREVNTVPYEGLCLGRNAFDDQLPDICIVKTTHLHSKYSILERPEFAAGLIVSPFTFHD
jgi:hypothetical protein